MCHAEGEEALAFSEAVEWMQFTGCNGKITCVDVAFVSAEQLGEICPPAVSLLGTRCKNWGWEGSRPVKQLADDFGRSYIWGVQLDHL